MAILYVSRIYPLNPCPEGLYVFLKHFRNGRMPITKENVYLVFSDIDFGAHIGWVYHKLGLSDNYGILLRKFGSRELTWDEFVTQAATGAYYALLKAEKLHRPTYPNV